MVEKDLKNKKKKKNKKDFSRRQTHSLQDKKYRSFMPICFAHSSDCYILISNLDLVKVLLFLCVPILLKDCG